LLAHGIGVALILGSADLRFEAPARPPDIGRSEASSPSGEHSAPLPLALPRMMPVHEPFDLGATRAPVPYAAKWRQMTFAIEQDRAILAGCPREPERCPPAAKRLLAIVDAARTMKGRARLGEINRSLNLAIRYQSDAVRHGTPDVWSSPLDTLASGAGDCEDYAIAKYLALSEAGMAPADLRLVIVGDTRLRQDHAVLAARLDGRWLLLDNRTLLLVDDQEARDYVGLTAFALQDQPLLMAADHREPMGGRTPPPNDAARPQPGRS